VPQPVVVDVMPLVVVVNMGVLPVLVTGVLLVNVMPLPDTKLVTG
jgi:hypothetical protein